MQIVGGLRSIGPKRMPNDMNSSPLAQTPELCRGESASMANPFGVQTYAQSLEQDPFNVEDYVNAAAWRCLTKEGAESEISEDFDPEELRQYFEEEIFNLQV